MPRLGTLRHRPPAPHRTAPGRGACCCHPSRGTSRLVLSGRQLVHGLGSSHHGDSLVGDRLPRRGRRRDGHGLHRRPDRPRRRARHARRPSPCGRRALAGRLSVRPAPPGVDVLRRRVDGARHRCRAAAAARRRGSRSGPGGRRSRATTTTSCIAASSVRAASRFLGGSEYHTDGTSHLVTSRVSGETTRGRRAAPGRRRRPTCRPTIPATTPPPFGVADGVRVVADQRARRAGRGADAAS